MCGIAGIITTRQEGIKERITAATSELLHRADGPTHHVVNNDQSVALGHCRLSIIDLTKSACQPLLYINRYTIVHNGEIYNYLELRKELQQKGYRFSSASDTEVIVAAYAAYGADCLQMFEGMFSFAIWDEEESILFAARDRFGEKPFYFSMIEDEFLFASEMKALWKAGVNREVNNAMLYNFLAVGYIFNPFDPQETFYNNIFKLPAASFLLYDKKTRDISINQYWQLDIEVNNSITETEAIDRFQTLFTESISRRLRSDVPIGTSLSGGLDSSSIVAYSSKVSSAQYTHKSFTAVFPGYEKDETEYASIVAEQYGLHHHEVTIPVDDIPAMVQNLMHFHEVPFSSASALVQYKVYEAAKANGVTVLLDGQGADELLAGYHKYYKWYWQELYRNRKLKRSHELEMARANNVNEAFSLNNKLAALMPDFAAAMHQSRKSKAAAKNKSLHKDFIQQYRKDFYYALPAQLTLNGALYYNTAQYGLEELLHMADRNSMAHATEVRLPFLDHNLVSFLFTLPPHFKIHNGWTKWLLRQSVNDILPSSIVWRKDKVGYEPPQKQWMERPDVQEAIYEGKKKLVDQKILNPGVLQEKLKPHDAHAAYNLDWKCWTASFLY